MVKMFKIFHVIDSLRTGGKERRLIELIKFFKFFHPEIQNEIISFSKSIDFQEIDTLAIKVHIIDRKQLSEFTALRMFLKVIRQNRPDVVHSWIGIGSIYTSIAKMIYNFKFINGIIASCPKVKVFSKLWFHSKPTFIFSDIVMSNSFAGLKAFKAPVKKSVCIHNGFNFDRIKNLEDKDSVRKRLNVTTPYIVGMVAAFSIFKDYDTYVKAANFVLNKRKDISFLCIGSGSKEKYIRMAGKDNLENILFVDNQQNVESIMNICDIGVLSSNSEGISNSIIEFMALEKPVIATSTGGTPELIADGESGFILKQGDHIAMADKIIELIDDKVKLSLMGKESNRIIKEKFSIERMGSDVYALYKKLTGEKEAAIKEAER